MLYPPLFQSPLNFYKFQPPSEAKSASSSVSGSGEIQESLPQWDLTQDFYPGLNSQELQADLKRCEDLARSFEKKYKLKFEDLTAFEFEELLVALEELYDLTGKLATYASLKQSVALDQPQEIQASQAIFEKLTDLSQFTLFVPLHLVALSQAQWEAWKEQNSFLQRYDYWVTRLFEKKDHFLSEELESYSQDYSIPAYASWSLLFDRISSERRIEVRGTVYTQTELFALLTSHDSTLRQESYLAFSKKLKEEGYLIESIYNALLKHSRLEDKWRKYEHVYSARNEQNGISDQELTALVSAVRSRYSQTSHRYFKLKAQILGKEKLNFWDRNAPLAPIDKKLSWEEAKHTVQEALSEFSPQFGEIVQEFFDKSWIDASVHPGKRGGAFAHGAVPSVHPFILMSYQGQIRDVMTLAHELGHGIHQYLAREQGAILDGTSLTLAETASVFSEMIVFQKIKETITDKEQKKLLLASKIEDILNTVVRQIAFHVFEEKVHRKRQEAELSSDDFANAWMESQQESFGPHLELSEDYHPFWAYIPHFIHTPFYVYAYAYGDCLVNALYQRYLKSSDQAGFIESFTNLLKAGGGQSHKTLLAPLGVDTEKEGFWFEGLDFLESLIDEFEAL